MHTSIGDTLLTAETHPNDVDADDPTVVRSIAITVDDVVTALEANVRRDAGVVVRITPPYSGRMRARIHVEGAESTYDEPAPIHVSPERLVASPPPFPTPDDTEDELRDDPDARYTPETHRLRHERAVERWRAAVRESIVDTVELSTSRGPHEVSVLTLD